MGLVNNQPPHPRLKTLIEHSAIDSDVEPLITTRSRLRND